MNGVQLKTLANKYVTSDIMKADSHTDFPEKFGLKTQFKPKTKAKKTFDRASLISKIPEVPVEFMKKLSNTGILVSEDYLEESQDWLQMGVFAQIFI